MERRIRDQSDTSVKFDARAAEACCTAALEIANLLPDQLDVDFVYSNGPWWTIIHISKHLSSEKQLIDTDPNSLVMQSTVVLLLETTYKTQDNGSSGPTLVPAIKKMIAWLKALQVNNPVADRAYGIIRRILEACTPALQAEVHDLLVSAEEGLSAADESQRSQDPSATQPEADWRQSNFANDSVRSSGLFAPEYFQQQPFEPTSEYQSGAFADYSTHRNMTALPFGNLFYTPFDQVTPMVNMEELLAASGYSTGFETHSWSPNVSQNQGEALHDLEGHVLFQQQYHHHDRAQQPPQ